MGASGRSPKHHSRCSDSSTASKIRRSSSKIKQYFNGIAHPRNLITPPESPVSENDGHSTTPQVSLVGSSQFPELHNKIDLSLATPPPSPEQDAYTTYSGFPTNTPSPLARQVMGESYQDHGVEEPESCSLSCPYGNQPAAKALRLMALPPAAAAAPVTPPRPRNPLAALMDGSPDEPPEHKAEGASPHSKTQERPGLPRQSSMPTLNRARTGRPALHGPRPHLPPLVTNLGADKKIFQQQDQSFSPRLETSPEVWKPTTPSSFVNSLSPVQGDISTAPTSLASDVPSAKDAPPSMPPATPATERIGTNQQAVPGPAGNLHPLPPIEESPMVTPVDSALSQHKSTNLSIGLVEKVAATKVYFETLYSSKEFSDVTPRSLRRRQMEKALYEATNLTPWSKSEQRRSFFRQETAYLRKLRNLKSRRMSEPSVSMDIAGFEAVRVLGKGSFGVVRLVREKTRSSSSLGRKGEKPVYAMKMIKKSDMLQNSQEGHLRAERDFLVSCAERSEWVVPLLASFQDVDHLYLVMEYEVGGDFLGLLLRETTLNEHATRFYIAEMIMCIEEAHRMKWIHRDVKPDNFLISASGHLKISDFGLAFDGHWSHNQSYYHDSRYSLLEQFGLEVDGDAQDRKESASSPKHRRPVKPQGAKDVFPSHRPWASKFERRRLAKSVVGTSQYMAPEVVRGSWYDGRCDWWSLGIIIFECLWGYTPFCREDREATKRAILDHGKLFVFPTPEQQVSTIVQDLIFRLLQEPDLRLCSSKYQNNDFHRELGKTYLADKGARDYRGHHVYADDAEEIKRHPFFHGIDWDILQQTAPPWVPRVNTADSTKYFESEEQILGDSSLGSAASLAAENMDKKMNNRSIDERRAAVGGMDGHRMPKTRKPKRRARDKLLRDPVVCKTVMDARKRSAFLGYTYRRPKMWGLVGSASSSTTNRSSDRYTEKIPGFRSRDTDGDTLMGGC